MFKPKKQIWRDNTEPPKNYIWERLNESGSYIGTYEFNGDRWVRIRDKKSDGGDSGDGGNCSCGDKFVPLSKNASIVYTNDSSGNTKFVTYSEKASNNTFVVRTKDGRIKSNEAKEKDDVVTFQDICWNEENFRY